MKILKIKQENIDEDKIVVEVEGYPHAQPVFDANISKEDLVTALEAWKVNQDEVDAINASQTKELKDEVDITELKTLIGKNLTK